MKALLIATAEGHKLASLNVATPAPLVPLLNRPLIDYVLETLARNGVGRAVAALGRRGTAVASYLDASQCWGVSVEYIWLAEPLGDAGAAIWAADMLDETTLILPADALIDLDLAEAFFQHRRSGADLTMIFARRPGASALAYSGACLIEPAVLATLRPGEPWDVASELAPALRSAGARVSALTMAGYWNPLTTLADYREAQQVVLDKGAASSAAAGLKVCVLGGPKLVQRHANCLKRDRSQ